MLKDFFEVQAKLTVISTLSSLTLSIIYGSLKYFNLLPNSELASRIIGLILFASYIASFILVGIFIQKYQSRKNLKKLQADIEKIKETS